MEPERQTLTHFRVSDNSALVVAPLPTPSLPLRDLTKGMVPPSVGKGNDPVKTDLRKSSKSGTQVEGIYMNHQRQTLLRTPQRNVPRWDTNFRVLKIHFNGPRRTYGSSLLLRLSSYLYPSLERLSTVRPGCRRVPTSPKGWRMERIQNHKRHPRLDDLFLERLYVLDAVADLLR